MSSVPVVEPLNAVVSRKKHRKLSARHLERVEHCFGSARQVCTLYPTIRATFDNEPDRHQVTDLLPGPYASAAPV